MITIELWIIYNTIKEIKIVFKKYKNTIHELKINYATLIFNIYFYIIYFSIVNIFKKNCM